MHPMHTCFTVDVRRANIVYQHRNRGLTCHVFINFEIDACKCRLPSSEQIDKCVLDRTGSPFRDRARQPNPAGFMTPITKTVTIELCQRHFRVRRGAAPPTFNRKRCAMGNSLELWGKLFDERQETCLRKEKKKRAFFSGVMPHTAHRWSTPPSAIQARATPKAGSSRPQNGEAVVDGSRN